MSDEACCKGGGSKEEGPATFSVYESRRGRRTAVAAATAVIAGAEIASPDLDAFSGILSVGSNKLYSTPAARGAELDTVLRVSTPSARDRSDDVLPGSTAVVPVMISGRLSIHADGPITLSEFCIDTVRMLKECE